MAGNASTTACLDASGAQILLMCFAARPHIIDAGMVTIPYEMTTTVMFPQICCPFCFRGSPGGVLTGQAMHLFKHKPLQSPCICKTVTSGSFTVYNRACLCFFQKWLRDGGRGHFRKWPPPEAPIFHFLTDGREKGRIRHFLRKKRKNPSFSLRDCEIRFFCLHFCVHLCPFLCVCVCECRDFSWISAFAFMKVTPAVFVEPQETSASKHKGALTRARSL